MSLFSLIIACLVRFNTSNKHHFLTSNCTTCDGTAINSEDRKEKMLEFTQVYNFYRALGK